MSSGPSGDGHLAYQRALSPSIDITAVFSYLDAEVGHSLDDRIICLNTSESGLSRAIFLWSAPHVSTVL